MPQRLEMLSCIEMDRIICSALLFVDSNGKEHYITHRATIGKSGLTHRKREFPSMDLMKQDFPPLCRKPSGYTNTDIDLGYGLTREMHCQAKRDWIQKNRLVDD
ncbi:MAG: hypothetical protein AABX23_01385 [Nanoarchaeota archaeon]